ncbi:hypothetical protein OY671_009667, partial [Metschnikowia pulcherrima]
MRAHGQVPPRPRGVRRRLGAPRLAVRRARRQQRRAGCREPGSETAPGAGRPGARIADRQLRRRTRARRRREHPELVARHRLHHAQERHQPQLPQRRAEPGPHPCVRAHASQQRPPVAARHLRRFAAEQPRPRHVRRPHAARRGGAGRAGARTRRLAVVAVATGRGFHAGPVSRRPAARDRHLAGPARAAPGR